MHALEVASFLGGIVAGFLGALVGIGGGVLLVPLLNGLLGLSFAEARGISLIGVLGTAASAVTLPAGPRLVNPRLAIFLLVFSVTGATIGAKYLIGLPERTYELVFGVTMGIIAVLMIARRNSRNVLSPGTEDLGVLGGRFYDHDTRRDVAYRVRRLPIAGLVSFIAGVLASIVGIGGGIVIVPTLNSLCGVPMRVAAATSVIMIGVTAIPGSVAAWSGGHLGDFHLAGLACLGAMLGFQAGFRASPRAEVKWLKVGLAVLLSAVSIQYLFLR